MSLTVECKAGVAMTAGAMNAEVGAAITGVATGITAAAGDPLLNDRRWEELLMYILTKSSKFSFNSQK